MLATSLNDTYGRDCRRVSGATRDELLRELPGADLVQFIGHGQSDLHQPLASGLHLADGLLTVRRLLMRPPTRQQQVILTSGGSCGGGGTPPDDVVTLPEALLHCGAAGVVATQWEIELRPATLLVRRLHELLRGGQTPLRALHTAQMWLRHTTQDEFEAAYPDVYRDDRADMGVERARTRPYADPFYWAAFCYTGG